MEKEGKNFLVKGGLFSFLGFAIFGISQLIYNMLIGRSFGAEVLGNVNFAISLCMFLAPLTCWGFPQALQKYLSEFEARGKRSEMSAVISYGLLIVSLLSVILFLLLFYEPSYLTFLFPDIDLRFFHQFSLFIILLSMYYVSRSILFGLREIKTYAKIEFITRTALLLLILVSIVVDNEEVIVLSFFTSHALFLFFVLYVLHKKGLLGFFPPINKTDKENFIKYAIFAVLISAMARTMARVDVLLIAHFMTAASLGYYSAIVAILNLFRLLPRILSSVFHPLVAYMYGCGDTDKLNKYFNNILSTVTIFTLFISFASILASRLMIDFMYGDEFLIAILPFNILVIGMFFSVITTVPADILAGTRYIHYTAKIEFFGMLVTVMSLVILIPQYGLVGAAIGTNSGLIINAILYFYYVTRVVTLDMKSLTESAGKSFLLFMPFLLINVYIKSIFVNLLSIILFFVFFALLNKAELLRLYGLIRSTLTPRSHG